MLGPITYNVYVIVYGCMSVNFGISIFFDIYGQKLVVFTDKSNLWNRPLV